MGVPHSNVFSCSFTVFLSSRSYTTLCKIQLLCDFVSPINEVRILSVPPHVQIWKNWNDIPDNVNGNISPWLFYHHFNSMWGHYARQLIQFWAWFKGQSNIDHSDLFWYEELLLACKCSVQSRAASSAAAARAALRCPPSQVRLPLHTGWLQFPVPSSGVLPENNWRRDMKILLFPYIFSH